ncbi:hypothetical protein ABPG74_016900 [Tetrahymena malaccensis]
MSMNNSYSYQYRTENYDGQRSTYTTPQYDEVVKKYMNFDPSQQRTTLAINQGLNQTNFSKSVSYQQTNNIGNNGGDQYGYSTVQYTGNFNQTQPGLYQDRFSEIKNVQIKDVQSPDKNLYTQYDFQEENDRVKKSKKTQEVTITQQTTKTYNNNGLGVPDYQPVFVGYEKQSLSQFNQGPSSSSQIIILENPDLAMQSRSSVNPRLESQNRVETKSIQDQNIALCNIF